MGLAAGCVALELARSSLCALFPWLRQRETKLQELLFSPSIDTLLCGKHNVVGSFRLAIIRSMETIGNEQTVPNGSLIRAVVKCRSTYVD
jgi:hypothetical protein